MNVTYLDDICKTTSHAVLKNAKHSLINHPFVDTKINEGIINDIIEFQINQKLGSSVMKRFTKTNVVETDQQRLFIDKKINYYKFHVVNAFKAFSKHIQ